jgi:RNase P/RNase MRP subunit p29
MSETIKPRVSTSPRSDIREARCGEQVRRVSDGMKGRVVDRDKHALSIIFEDTSAAIVRLQP